MQLKKITLIVLILTTSFIGHSQFNVGAHFSTFHLPAIPFKASGGGLSAQIDDGRTAYLFSLGYFPKKMPIDSFRDNGSDVKFQEQHKFIQLSADFSKSLIGSNDEDDKFSLFCGAGFAVVYKMDKLKALTASYQDANENKLKAGFEFLAGVDYKFGPVRVYLKGKASMFLSHIIPVSDGTTMPLLTNTELGFLIPLKRN